MSQNTDRLFQTFTEVGIINQLRQEVLRKTLPEPLTTAQFFVLIHLSRVPHVNTPTRITKAFQVTKGAMTHTLGLLQSNDWIRIENNPDDGRGKFVHMTDEGAAILHETVKKMHPYFTRLAAEIPTEDIETLTKILTKIRIYMDKARD